MEAGEGVSESVLGRNFFFPGLHSKSGFIYPNGTCPTVQIRAQSRYLTDILSLFKRDSSWSEESV